MFSLICPTVLSKPGGSLFLLVQKVNCLVIDGLENKKKIEAISLHIAIRATTKEAFFT